MESQGKIIIEGQAGVAEPDMGGGSKKGVDTMNIPKELPFNSNNSNIISAFSFHLSCFFRVGGSTWVSSLAYPNLLAFEGFVGVAVFIMKYGLLVRV